MLHSFNDIIIGNKIILGLGVFMKTQARFLYFQDVQLFDKLNIPFREDMILEDGSVLRFDDNGYLHGTIETGDGFVEQFEHGKLHGTPAVVSQDLKYLENWQYGILKKIMYNGKEENF